MNIQLHQYGGDRTSLTGMKIIKAIIDGKEMLTN
jgi:hypothetical protein